MGVPEIILEHDDLTDILRKGFECTEKCAWCTGFWAGGKNDSSILIIRYHNSRRPPPHSRYIADILRLKILIIQIVVCCSAN